LGHQLQLRAQAAGGNASLAQPRYSAICPNMQKKLPLFFSKKKKKCRRSIRVLIEHSTLVLGYSVHEITDMLLILFSLAIPTGRPKLNTILVVGFN
jgi:hypothetical protein